jgi:uroporphyrinogen decarboxylase
VFSLDWRLPLPEAAARLGCGQPLQGNLDPCALFAPLPEIERRVRAILAGAAALPGHIFNLGHGILPQTPWEQVRATVELVHELARRPGRG